MNRITILLADDHAIVREALRILLQGEVDLRVVGEAADGREAVRLTRKLLPDVVLMDIAMPRLNGLEATRQILREVPGTRVLVLSSYTDDTYVRQLIEAGVAGYLIKETESLDLVHAIRQAFLGNVVCSPVISTRLLAYCRRTLVEGRPRPAIPTGLTSRENEVLQLIAEGESSKGIAAELCLSCRTVEKHRLRLMHKLDLHEVASLTRYAIGQGIIRSSEGGGRLQVFQA